jgi:hypothetical protein
MHRAQEPFLLFPPSVQHEVAHRAAADGAWQARDAVTATLVSRLRYRKKILLITGFAL